MSLRRPLHHTRVSCSLQGVEVHIEQIVLVVGVSDTCTVCLRQCQFVILLLSLLLLRKLTDPPGLGAVEHEPNCFQLFHPIIPQ
jgi:hypothetical protein